MSIGMSHAALVTMPLELPTSELVSKAQRLRVKAGSFSLGWLHGELDLASKQGCLPAAGVGAGVAMPRHPLLSKDCLQGTRHTVSGHSL